MICPRCAIDLAVAVKVKETISISCTFFPSITKMQSNGSDASLKRSAPPLLPYPTKKVQSSNDLTVNPEKLKFANVSIMKVQPRKLLNTAKDKENIPMQRINVIKDEKISLEPNDPKLQLSPKDEFGHYTVKKADGTSIPVKIRRDISETSVAHCIRKKFGVDAVYS